MSGGSSVPELLIRLRLEAVPTFELSATSDDLPRLIDWLGSPRAAGELRAVARSLAVIAGLVVEPDNER